MLIRERAYWYNRRATVAASTRLSSESISLNGMPTSFVLRALKFQSSNFTLRCRDERGQYFQSVAQLGGNMTTNANQPSLYPVWPEKRFPAAATFVYDAENRAVAPDTYDLTLWGAHEVPAGAPDPYPARYDEDSYILPVTFDIAASSRVSVPLFVRENVTFAIRTLNFEQDETFGAGTVPTNTRIHIRDENGQSYMNEAVNIRHLFAFFGSEEPGTPSPEMIIPAGRAYRLDVQNDAAVGPFRIQLAFGGALLYQL
jgi:hypothetical protein